MTSSYFLSAVLAGERAGRETRPGSMLNPTRQNQTCTCFPSNRRVVQVNPTTRNLISFLLGFQGAFVTKVIVENHFLQQKVEYLKLNHEFVN